MSQSHNNYDHPVVFQADIYCLLNYSLEFESIHRFPKYANLIVIALYCLVRLLDTFIKKECKCIGIN